MSDGPLALDGELTIMTAVDVKPALLGLVGREDPALDLSQVWELDTAGLQLLLLVHREVAATGRRLRVVAASEPVTAVLAIAGLGLDLVPQLDALVAVAATA